jgi:glycosyltransferase involved in cell wall biosynthesis
VCHFSTAHRADDIRIVLKECVSLAAGGFDTAVVIRGQIPASVRGVRHVVLQDRTGGRLTRFIRSAFEAFDLARRERASVYHFHDPDLLPWALVLRLLGRRVIYDAHEDVPRDILSKPWVAPGLRRPLAAVFEVFENAAAARMSAVVGATPHIADRFSRINRSTVCINNFPWLDELSPPAGGSGPRQGFCYVGAVSTIRCAFEMVEAARIADARLVVAGPIKMGADEARLRASAGWSSVDYRGTLGREQVRDLLVQSIAGMVLFHPEPNHENAQPNKLFEYMSAGLPLIASNFPLWREIVERHECGLCVDPMNPHEIARAMRTLQDDPALAERLGRNGRLAVERVFNWESEKTKLIDLYRKLSTA